MSIIPPEWRTHAESTDYRETPNYDDTIAFARRLAHASPSIECESFGFSAQGRELPLEFASKKGTFPPAPAKAENKAVVLIQACIHSGEPDGKDAGFALLRAIAIPQTHTGKRTNICVLS